MIIQHVFNNNCGFFITIEKKLCVTMGLRKALLELNKIAIDTFCG